MDEKACLLHRFSFSPHHMRKKMYQIRVLKVEVNLPDSTKGKDWAKIHAWESSKAVSLLTERKEHKASVSLLPRNVLSISNN